MFPMDNKNLLRLMSAAGALEAVMRETLAGTNADKTARETASAALAELRRGLWTMLRTG